MLKPSGTAKITFSSSLLARLNVDNGEGCWGKDGDFNLVLGSSRVDSASKNGLLRVMQYAGKYRLIVEDYEDPDMWDGSFGFKRKNM